MSRHEFAAQIAAVGRLIADATDILFITGAGISAESGVPTYRGLGGLYEGDLPAEDGFAIEEILSGSMFAARPELTWKYLWQIGAACARAEPNAAHRALAQLEAEKPNVWVITQNVDGLHRAAGSRNLIEIHGHAFDLFCTDCGHRYEARAFFDLEDAEPELPPRCDDCGGMMRPDVVLFEEMLPEAAIAKMLELASANFDVVVSIGTSALFPYINEPIYLANRRSVPTVEINPCDTEVSRLVDHCIRLGAAETMPRVLAAMRE